MHFRHVNMGNPFSPLILIFISLFQKITVAANDDFYQPGALPILKQHQSTKGTKTFS